MKTRLNIDRIVVRTRGLTPAAAEVAAQGIGPALARAVESQKPGSIGSLKITVPAASAASPAALAQQIAAQLTSTPRESS